MVYSIIPCKRRVCPQIKKREESRWCREKENIARRGKNSTTVKSQEDPEDLHYVLPNFPRLAVSLGQCRAAGVSRALEIRHSFYSGSISVGREKCCFTSECLVQKEIEQVWSEATRPAPMTSREQTASQGKAQHSDMIRVHG